MNTEIAVMLLKDKGVIVDAAENGKHPRSQGGRHDGLCDEACRSGRILQDTGGKYSRTGLM
jgi:hypothetical protein